MKLLGKPKGNLLVCNPDGSEEHFIRPPTCLSKPISYRNRRIQRSQVVGHPRVVFDSSRVGLTRLGLARAHALDAAEDPAVRN